MSLPNPIQVVLDCQERIQKLRRKVGRHKSNFIASKDLLEEMKAISETWFKITKPQLDVLGFPSKIVSKYDELFKSLLNYGYAKNNRKSSVIKTLDSIKKSFKSEIIIAIQTGTHSPRRLSEWSDLVPDITGDEKEYLEEAFFCAEHVKYRASMVLIWCAAIDRMHRTIEKNLGYQRFSTITEEMANRTNGEYQQFRRPYEVRNLGELRNVPDRVIVFSLRHEGMITPNQYKKLKNCLDYRNLSAHPGETIISKQNLASVISDLNEIIFDNAVFDI